MPNTPPTTIGVNPVGETNETDILPTGESAPVCIETSADKNKSSEPPLCKHWARYKDCLYHSRGKCKFSHPDSTIPTNPMGASTLPRHRTPGGRLQTRNDARVAQFRHFMATKLKEHTNNKRSLEGARVLDVAGGKGELAYQLIHLCGVESCHVVDPRALSLGRFQQRRQRGFYHRSIFLHPEIVSKKDDEEVDVGHLRCLFTEELWKTTASHCDNQEKTFREINGRATEAWIWPPPRDGNKCKGSDRKGDYHHENDNDRDDDPTEQQQTPFPSYDYASSVTQSATLIAGMHVDQAVDAIVDAAVHLGISFFVVPCCTYSAEFPHRKTVPLGDRTVKTYDELLDYLQAKSGDIQRATLPFEGKNVCLYRIVD